MINRKTILITLLAVAGSSAALELARWVVVDSRENFSIYADPATVRRTGSVAQMWDMSDAKQGKVLGGVRQAVSSKIEREYDCGKQQMRILYVSWHAGNMGEGEMVGSDANPGSWQPVMLGTIGERLWKIACGTESRRRL